MYNACLVREIQRERSKEPWLGLSTDNILKLQYQASQYPFTWQRRVPQCHVDMSQCIRSSSDAVEVRTEEGAESQWLLVSRHLESHWTLNTKVIGFGCGPWRWYRRVGENTYEPGESRRGEERRGKEMDGCPLTLPPLQSVASRCARTARKLPDLLWWKGLSRRGPR
jgi:hypothetical protein